MPASLDYVDDNLLIVELHAILAGSRLRNATDVKKWFYHIPLDKSSRKYAGIRVKGHVLIPKRALQGLKKAQSKQMKHHQKYLKD